MRLGLSPDPILKPYKKNRSYSQALATGNRDGKPNRWHLQLQPNFQPAQAHAKKHPPTHFPLAPPRISGITRLTQGGGRSSVVEHFVANEDVVSSNLIARSNFPKTHSKSRTSAPFIVPQILIAAKAVSLSGHAQQKPTEGRVFGGSTCVTSK